jgi:hypothetical protein
MRSLLFLIIFCSLNIAPPKTHGQNQQSQDNSQKILTAEDFINGTANPIESSEAATFLIRINRKLLPYTIRVIPDPNANSSDVSEPRPTYVGTIEISSQNPSSKAQVIKAETIIWPQRMTHFFKAEDINFDGYLDLAVLYDGGAKWGRYKYWLFDKKTDRFVTNSLTRRLGTLSYNTIDLNPKTKEIKLGSYKGVCPQSRTYRILKRTPLLMEVEERECKMDGDKVRIKRRINGKLRLVKTRFEKY